MMYNLAAVYKRTQSLAVPLNTFKGHLHHGLVLLLVGPLETKFEEYRSN